MSESHIEPLDAVAIEVRASNWVIERRTSDDWSGDDQAALDAWLEPINGAPHRLLADESSLEQHQPVGRVARAAVRSARRRVPSVSSLPNVLKIAAAFAVVAALGIAAAAYLSAAARPCVLDAGWRARNR